MKSIGRELILAATLAAAPLAASAADPAPLAVESPAAAEPWQRYGDWPKGKWPNFSTLRDSKSPPAPKPDTLREIGGLTAGDAEKGAKLAFDRSRGGGCVACHVMGPKTPEMPGNVGPDLSTVGTLGYDDRHLFNMVYDARVYNPDTVMPPWGTHALFTDAEIMDIVAFLKTLTSPAVFKTEIDDPAKRPVPKETRDNLDVFTNPGADEIDTGKALFAETCARCHQAPETAFKTWAATMPRFEPRLDKALGIEEFIARHAAATTDERFLMQTAPNTSLAIYLRALANGTPIEVKPQGPAAEAALERGRQLTERKIGQLNFACTDCHHPDKGGNKWIRGQWLGENKGQLPHFPTWRTSRNEIWDIRKRFQWCGVAIRADELPPDAKEYGDLELYLATVNNGLKLNVPGIRH